MPGAQIDDLVKNFVLQFNLSMIMSETSSNFKDKRSSIAFIIFQHSVN